tara:strand:- start:6613 stop:6906 length:294 start_codon:yes stop_codon:yes gene_type:complete
MTLNFKRIYLKKNIKLDNLKAMLEKNININLIIEFEEPVDIHKAQLDFLNLFLEKSKKSLVVISSNLDFEEHNFSIAPSFQEAKDIIEIEEIERLIS